MDTKQTIMYCAVKLFASRGYDAVGIQEIVDSAGIQKPTLYYYFRSKKGLLEAIADQYFGILIGEVAIAAEYRRDITNTLTKLMTTFFDFAMKYPEFYRMQLGMNLSSPDNEANQVVRQRYEELFKIIEHLFEKSAQEHGNMRGRHYAYAATFIGMLDTYTTMALNGYITLDQKVRVQALHQFMHGIFS